jgi:DNA replication protein DnaC
MSADTLYQQLRGHLHYLKLAALADALEHAERERPGYTEFLAALMKTEVDATEQRRLQGRLRFSKLPARKTLQHFDHDVQPSLDGRMIDELATLQFIAEKANVLLIGPPGVGKTHLVPPSCLTALARCFADALTSCLATLIGVLSDGDLFSHVSSDTRMILESNRCDTR